MLPQDLHIHTVYSANDPVVVPEQTIELIARLRHASVIGISDHLDHLVRNSFEAYVNAVRRAGLKLGVEVDGSDWVSEAVACEVDYYILHCRDTEADYRSQHTLLATGKPVIIAHPTAFNTNLRRIAPECLIEINNRYVWKSDWQRYYTPFRECFKFVIGSDAHQPHWLGQTMARHAAAKLGITEHILFTD